MTEKEKAKLIRRLCWIAFVWNDHSFEHGPEYYAQEELEKLGITSLEAANLMLEDFEFAIELEAENKRLREALRGIKGNACSDYVFNIAESALCEANGDE